MRREERSEDWPYCSRFNLAICSLRWAISAASSEARAWAFARSARVVSSSRWAVASSAFSASISSGTEVDRFL